MIDLDEIEGRAKAATPGRWKWDPDDGSFGSSQDDGSHHVTVAFGEPVGESNPRIAISDEDAAHIAACSPETILALVRVARAAKTWRQRLIDRPAASRDVIVGLADELVDAVDALGTETPFCKHCGAHRNNMHDGCCPLSEDDQ